MRWVLVVLSPLLLLAACAPSEDRVTNGDRQLSWQNRGAAVMILQAATTISAAIAAAGVPAPAPALAALALVESAATDIHANSDQQIANWGGEGRIEGKLDYSPEASATARKKSKEEHEKLTWWFLAGGAGLTILGWVLRSTPLGKIPILGGLLAKISPRLANGATTNEAINVGLQVAIDKARTEFDGLAERIRQRLAGGPLAGLADQIPSGDRLKEILERELSRRGILEANTRLYEGNAEIPDETPTAIVTVQPGGPAPATASPPSPSS